MNLDLLDGLRILLVEDEPDTRELFKVIFEGLGAQVIAVDQPGEALLALECHKPDILLCDIKLPYEHGYTLIRKVRTREAELGGQIPAIAVTGFPGESERTLALSAGFQIYICKPIDLDELVKAVASLRGCL